MPERTKVTQVGARRSEPLEETCQHRLNGHARDPEQFRHERIAPQIGDVGGLARLTQQAVHEGQRFFQRQRFVVGQRQRVGQTLAPIQRPQPTPEHGAARAGGKAADR